MKYAFILLILSLSTESNMKKIYTFSNQTNIKEWRIVNDGVMGGISKSSLLLTDAGHGQFSGHVSLANNGGFASMQLNTTLKNRGVQHCTPTKSLWKNRPATKRAGEKMGQGERRFINRRAVSMFRSGFHFKITERMTRLGI